MSNLFTIDACCWHEAFSSERQQQALSQLEAGNILYFPQLAFKLNTEEHTFLTPDYADPQAKNISYLASQNKLWGVQRLSDQQRLELKAMLDRYTWLAYGLIKNLLPRYLPDLNVARTSYRPLEVSQRKISPRKDDKRLHVDAFPSAPNQGKRILRVFSNINPHGLDRVWRIGEPFEQVAKRFLPRLKSPLPGSASCLRLLRITKSYRTLYDHYMLQLHDTMKADDAYQQQALQHEVYFPAGSTWIVQTDHVSHAAMSGQYVLEQTFHLPIGLMQEPNYSPLRILEGILAKRLV